MHAIPCSLCHLNSPQTVFNKISSFILIGFCPQTMMYSIKAGHCYAITEEEHTWDEADVACRQLHPMAHLADMETEEEQTAVESLLKLKTKGTKRKII